MRKTKEQIEDHDPTPTDLLRVTRHASPVMLCFHCHEPIPAGVEIAAHIDARMERVCCQGCRAVAELIASAGLQDYYRFREQPAQRVVENSGDDEWALYEQRE